MREREPNRENCLGPPHRVGSLHNFLSLVGLLQLPTRPSKREDDLISSKARNPAPNISECACARLATVEAF